MITESVTATATIDLRCKTIAVPLYKRGAVEEKLTFFAKKAKKYGFAAPIAVWDSETFFDQVWVSNHDKTTIEFVNVTITFEPIYAPGGWQFAAMLDRTESGNLLSGPLSGKLGHLRTAELRCDHCKTNRARKKHYVLVNQDGEQMILGSACVKDYFGYNPAAAIESMHVLDWMREPSDWDDCAPPDDYYTVELKKVAALTAAFVRRVGFVSVAQAQEDFGSPPTWSSVNYQIFGKKVKEEDRIHPTDQEQALAQQVIERWEAIAKRVEVDREGADEWDYRKYLFVRNGYVSALPKQMSPVVGMIAREYKQIAAEIERSILGEPEFFGTPNQREDFDLTITRIQLIPDTYGGKELIAGVLNGTPHRFIWWNSGQREQFQEGVIRVSATVKEHSSHEQYGKQTVLIRVKPAKSKAEKTAKKREKSPC